MADAPKFIIYFSSQTIQLATVAGSVSSRKIEREKEAAWTKETLSATLIGIKKKIRGTPAVVMVDDDLAFTFGITVPTDVQEEKNFVRIKASQTVPEEIDDTGWDFKDVLESVDKKNKIVQFASVDNQFCALLAKAILDSGIEIESAEPMICSLARLLRKKPEPTLVIYRAKKILVFLAYQGLVFSVESFDIEPTQEQITKFLEFVKEEFGFAPKTAFFSGKFGSLGSVTSGLLGLKVEIGELDPFLGMAMKNDSAGKGEATLNIKFTIGKPSKEKKIENKIIGISEIGKEPGMEQYEPIVEEKSSRRHTPGLVFNTVILGLSFLVLLGNGIILYQRNQVAAPSTATVTTPSVTPGAVVVAPVTETSSTETTTVVMPVIVTSSATTTTLLPSGTTSTSPVVDLAAYDIEILNGGGKTGAAKTLETDLVAQSFIVSAVGNANSFNNTDTVVGYKDSVPDNYRQALEQALGAGFVVIHGPSLNAGSKFDVEIILGKN